MPVLVLFDIDDTLVDYAAAFRSATTALHEEVGAPRALEDFLLTWTAAHERHYPGYLAGDLSYEDMRRARVRETIDPALSAEAADRLFGIYLASYESHWSLFADVRPCLDRLSRHRLGVISNGPGAEQRSKLVRMGISHLFEGVFISEECGVAKPAAEIFLRACSTLGEPPTNAVHVGDRYDFDAEAARRAGLHGVWLDRKCTATARHLTPIIRILDELVPLLESGELLPNPGTPSGRDRCPSLT